MKEKQLRITRSKRQFTDKQIEQLAIKSLRGDATSQQVLEDAYEGMVERIGFYKKPPLTPDELIMRFKKRCGYKPSKTQVTLLTAVLGVTEYKIYHYKHKNVMFERDWRTKRIIRKVRDVKKV